MTCTYENSARKNWQKNIKCFVVLPINRHVLHTSDTTVYLDRGRSDRVVVLRAYRNCGGLSNYFKSFAFPKRLQILVIQRHKLDLLGIPKLVRLMQMLLRGIQLTQLGAVARQVVLDRAIAWKKLCGFEQHRFGSLYATIV